MAKEGSVAEEPENPVNEVVNLIKGYAMQETVEPLKPIGKFVAFGAAGGVLMGLGLLLMSLAMLRGLQTIDFFEGNWSLLAYLAVGAAVLAVAGLFASRIKKDL